jgi:hypothetical protein
MVYKYTKFFLLRPRKGSGVEEVVVSVDKIGRPSAYIGELAEGTRMSFDTKRKKLIVFSQGDLYILPPKKMTEEEKTEYMKHLI